MRVDILVFILPYEEVSYFIIVKYNGSCGIFEDAFYQIKIVPFYSYFAEFYHEKMVNSVKCFLLLYLLRWS